MARWIFSLAADTGWSRHEIKWEIPLKELLQYRHAQLIDAGCWTFPACAILPPADQLAKLKDAFTDDWPDHP